VLSILTTLLGFVTINLSSSQQKTSLSTTVQTIISDMKAQQIKAMTSDTEGRPTPSSYGIHFDANQYVLFHGSAYLSTDPSNFVVPLPPNLECTIPTDVIFSQRSGEIGASTAITIENVTSSEQRTIQLNKYGVVTAVN